MARAPGWSSRRWALRTGLLIDFTSSCACPISADTQSNSPGPLLSAAAAGAAAAAPAAAGALSLSASAGLAPSEEAGDAENVRLLSLARLLEIPTAAAAAEEEDETDPAAETASSALEGPATRGYAVDSEATLASDGAVDPRLNAPAAECCGPHARLVRASAVHARSAISVPG